MFVLTLSAHITIEKGKIIELIKSKRMPIIEISSLSHPGVEIFSTLTEAQLRNRIDSDRGIFIAESPKVIQVALDAGYEPLAILCEQKHIIGDAAVIIERSRINNSHINRKLPDSKLIIYDVLHYVCHFLLAEADSRISKPYILTIIFIRRIKIGFSL